MAGLLLNCPHCGNVPDFIYCESIFTGFEVGYFVMCDHCKTEPELNLTKAEAIERWNNLVSDVLINFSATKDWEPDITIDELEAINHKPDY